MVALKVISQKTYSPSRGLPLVSIIITSYNYERFLPQTIDSALNQTYPFKEVIVVDDGSTDNSPTIINSYGNKITPIFQENRGVGSATNAGFLASQGEIIFFLDSDDIFFPQKVEEMVKYFLLVMPQTPEAMIFHRVQLTTDDGIVLGVKPKRLRTVDGKKKDGLFKKLSDPETAYRHVQKWGFLPHWASTTSGYSLTRSLASHVFPLPEEIKHSQDYFLVLASWLLGTVYGTTQVLGSWTIHGDNLSFSEGKAVQCEIAENYVNDILQKMNKDRIASYYESRYAQAYYRYRGSTRGLLKLAYKIPARFFLLKNNWLLHSNPLVLFRKCPGYKKRT